MQIEAFSQGKHPARPEANEDRFVILRDRAYAVIDGISDKTGRRFFGQTGGRYAGAAIAAVLSELCPAAPPPELSAADLVAAINRRIREGYVALGIADLVRERPEERVGAQLVLALHYSDRFRFIIVGDSGLRLNGGETFRATYAADIVSAELRRQVWLHLGAAGADVETINREARRYTLHGLTRILPGTEKLIGTDDLARLRQTALAALIPRLAAIAPAILVAALDEGMLGQHRYQNILHPLGYPTIDGFPVPAAQMICFDRPKHQIDTIELFSDGYFGAARGTKLADWEGWIEEVERRDPHKIGPFASTKGSFGASMTDDRTILVLRPNLPPG